MTTLMFALIGILIIPDAVHSWRMGIRPLQRVDRHG